MTQTGRVAIITGAGLGIGQAIAKKLASQGAKIVLNDLDPLLAEQAAARIRDDGHACLSIAGDASDSAMAQQLVAGAISEFGRLDMAIANAGVTLFGSFWDYPPEQLRRVLDVNLGGSFFLAQAAAREMKRQGGGGRILFMSSVTGHQAHKDLAAYGMTKAALEMLARALVVELSDYGITVNALAPGATLTERTVNDESYEGVWSKLTPLGKPATTEDVAEAALFILSKSAGHITGQTLVIDGGWTCISPGP